MTLEEELQAAIRAKAEAGGAPPSEPISSPPSGPPVEGGPPQELTLEQEL